MIFFFNVKNGWSESTPRLDFWILINYKIKAELQFWTEFSLWSLLMCLYKHNNLRSQVEAWIWISERRARLRGRPKGNFYITKFTLTLKNNCFYKIKYRLKSCVMIHPICSAYIHFFFFRKKEKYAYFTFLLNYFIRCYILDLWDGCDWNLPAFVSSLSAAWLACAGGNFPDTQAPRGSWLLQSTGDTLISRLGLLPCNSHFPLPSQGWCFFAFEFCSWGPWFLCGCSWSSSFLALPQWAHTAHLTMGLMYSPVWDPEEREASVLGGIEYLSLGLCFKIWDFALQSCMYQYPKAIFLGCILLWIWNMLFI